ncbi:MAG: 3-deoxy-manno-octulosonate cytidylyltransferase [Pirellulaceae bacterium]|nr:3-deoxy-manno-octulosonate cytidylyltransferase [Pirellulaceae bacterium]
MSSSPSPHLSNPKRSRIVIPARLASTRLPEKLLLCETGLTLLEHTYRAASRAKIPEGITVAVDHPRLLDEVVRFGGEAQLTDPNAKSGTDRVVEVAAKYPEIDFWINVQGDEPEMDASAIDLVVGLLAENPDVSVATLATPIRQRNDLDDPNCVKVVCASDGRALYFSRSPIPYPREWNDALLKSEPPLFLQHLGIYAYRREFLSTLESLPNSNLEQTEKLEQLRFLQAGLTIMVGQVAHATRGIDTRADYDAFLARQVAHQPHTTFADKL